jgi:hypothetical protein
MIDARIFPDFRFGVVRGITYGMWGGAGVFMPAVRDLGARTTRVYIYWSQVEPEPGRFTWDTVDALLAQLIPDDEAWITVSSSSTWATERGSPFLPPSPAKDPARFASFVSELVRHCRGRIRFWQCDNEPCVPILWAGTIEAYLNQLRVFHEAVRTADPSSLVVLGGAPPQASGLGGPGPGGDHDVRYFDRLLREGGSHFDILDVHLYGDPYVIPETIARWRERLAAAGLIKPIVAGEYGGPLLFQYDVARQALFAEMGPPRIGETPEPARDGPEDANAIENPDEPAVAALYSRMKDLPPELQMFMAGCSEELEAKRHRIAARELVMRNVLAAASGVHRTLAWNLAPEVPGELSPYHVHSLLFDKLKLMDYEGEVICRRYPAANALNHLTSRLGELKGSRRIQLGDQPDVFAFEAQRVGLRPCVIVWERRNGWASEDDPAVEVEIPWDAESVRGIDVFGSPVAARVSGSHVMLDVGSTPVFLEP